MKQKEKLKRKESKLVVLSALIDIEEEEEKINSLQQRSAVVGCMCQARILVVDDTAFNIVPVRHLLKDYFNIDIEIAENGLEALNMFQKELEKPCGCELRAYRLIIMDLGMPVMGGEEASEKILALAEKAR